MFTGVTVTDQNEIVDRHNTHRASVSPTATNMLQMVGDDKYIAVQSAEMQRKCLYIVTFLFL